MLLMFSFQSADFSFNWRLGDFSEFSRDDLGEWRWGVAFKNILQLD